MIELYDLLCELILLVRKAAQIARFLRKDPHLLQLLCEKKEAQKGHFNCDFKTLADVIIQQLVVTRLKSKFPFIRSIKGEENDSIACSDGRVVQIQIHSNVDHLTSTLNRVIQDGSVCKKLAILILKKIKLYSYEPERLKEECDQAQLNEKDLGIWIDPIDGTNQYVKSDEELEKLDSLSNEPFAVQGLLTVSCLIGGYRFSDGFPMLGVVQLPFHGYYGMTQWAVNIPNQVCISNVIIDDFTCSSTLLPTLLLGTDACSDALAIELTKEGYKVIRSSGAGYKLWLLVNGHADFWIVPSATVFKWDICAGHTLLQVAHSFTKGDIVTLEDENPINYTPAANEQAISNLIAYRSQSGLLELKRLLAKLLHKQTNSNQSNLNLNLTNIN